MVWGLPPSFRFEIHVASLGPYSQVLELKRRNSPYREERFRVRGLVRVRTSAHHISGVTVTYLGRMGSEVKLAEYAPGWLEFPTAVEVPVDVYLDVDTQWRGLGIQAIKVSGSTGWETDVHVYVDLCYDLTWVG